MGSHAINSEPAVPVAIATMEPVRIGLIADVQYADADDGSDFAKTETRYFRNALKILASAVEVWNARGVDTVVQLGDIIDGSNSKAGESEKALSTVLGVFGRCKARRRFDLVGNHELYNFQKHELTSR